jgi:hypothetical protein
VKDYDFVKGIKDMLEYEEDMIERVRINQLSKLELLKERFG